MHPTFNLQQHLVVNTARIRQELGYQEIIPQEEAIKLTVEWERAHPPVVADEQFDYDSEDEILKKMDLIE
jgi:hypothetical protein